MPPHAIQTTDARQRLPDLLQGVYGDKSTVIVARRDRPLGALVPIEAVMILAGRGHELDPGLRARVERLAAEALG